MTAIAATPPPYRRRMLPNPARTLDPMTQPGTDDRPRCGWVSTDPLYLAYHDEEWGRPLHGDTALFEKLSLEAFQSGLAWITVLRKRESFRSAFAGFDPATVAGFDQDDVDRLLADAGIIRNRMKVEAVVSNAGALVAMQRRDGPDALDRLIWGFAPEPRESAQRPATLAQVPATTEESQALAKALKREGFRFVGPTTAYALMQSAGLVDDHVSGCWRASA